MDREQNIQTVIIPSNLHSVMSVRIPKPLIDNHFLLSLLI